jgi:hypothetical protein
MEEAAERASARYGVFVFRLRIFDRFSMEGPAPAVAL